MGKALKLCTIVFLAVMATAAAQKIGIWGDRDAILQIKNDLEAQAQRVYLDLGNAFMRNAQWEEASASYNAALTYEPSYAQAMNNQGVVALKQQKPASAAAWFESAIAQDPGEALYRYNRGILAVETGDFNTASAYFKSVTQIEPQNAHAWFDLGVALGLIAKKFGDRNALLASRDAFMSVLELEPGFPNAKQNLLITQQILALDG